MLPLIGIAIVIPGVAFRVNPLLVVARGTLMTPMAANFNILPAKLLDLPDDNAVIKAQIPTALGLLAANIAIMYLFSFR